MSRYIFTGDPDDQEYAHGIGGDPYLPPGASDADDYFNVPNANGAYPKRKETVMRKDCTTGDHDDCRSISCRCECHQHNDLPTCEICGLAPAFTQTNDRKYFQCVNCAAKAGHREAILMRSQQSALDLLNGIDKPEAA